MVEGMQVDISKYPVLTAHVPSRERWYNSEPSIVTTSTNRNVLHPTTVNKKKRKKDIEERLTKDKLRSSSKEDHQYTKSKHRAPVVEDGLRDGSSSSLKSGRSQLVDLVVKDEEAEEIERVRGRKEGGAGWNIDRPEHFV